METIIKNKQRWLVKPLLAIALSFISISLFAQNPTDSLPEDPGGGISVSVSTIQNMSFGAFATGGSGGTVEVSNTGTRSVTGTVTALNLGPSYFQSTFEIDAPQGTIISILNGPDITLPGSNGGSISLHLNNSQPASPFATTAAQPARTQVSIGGTLTVGNSAASPPGAYSGTFAVTFNNQ